MREDKMNELFSLENKTIIITGAAGYLGHEYMAYFEGQGAKIVGWDYDWETMKISDKILFQKVDICNPEEISKALLAVESVDILICNAAIDFPPNKPPVHSKLKVLETNVLGVQNCIEAVRNKILGGSIILIGSIYGMVSPDKRIYGQWEKPSIYSVTKSALYGMTKYYAAHFASSSIRVNIVTLGGVFSNQSDDFKKRYSEKVPIGRMAFPDDYFGVLHFLASDASRYMTGANLIVDGGYTAW
mgnify:CR=1 FL=1